MNFSILRLQLISFFGLQHFILFFRHSPEQHFRKTTFFFINFINFFMWTRVFTNVAVLFDSSLESYLIEFRVTDTWLKNAWYAFLAVYMATISIFCQHKKSWIIDQPMRWSRMLMFKFFGPIAKYEMKSVYQFSKKFDTKSIQTINYFRFQSTIIRCSFLMSFNLNQLTALTGLYILNQAFQQVFTIFSVPIQIFWFLHYKYTYNKVAVFIADAFMLYVCNICFFSTRLKALNHHLKRVLLVRRQYYCKNHNYRDQIASNEFNFQYKFVRLADEIQYAKKIASPLMSLIYFVGVFCSLNYFFLGFFSNLISISPIVLMFFNLFVSGTFLFPACFLGQMITNQVIIELEFLIFFLKPGLLFTIFFVLLFERA